MPDKKRILILSPHFFPEPISTGKFNTELAISLRDQGYEVSVLCYHPVYPGWQINPTNEQLEGIRIHRMGKRVYLPKQQFLIRLILEISYAINVLLNYKKLTKNVDIILPVFPPSLAFYFLRNRLSKSIHKVGMIHDLQEVYSQKNKGSVYKLVSRFINHVEKKCYQSCDKIIFLSGEMKTKAQELYQLNPDRLFVQYPFITLEDKVTDDLNHIFTKNKIHITYSGALGEKQNPWKLYEFFDQASKQIEDSEFHIFSQGDIFEGLKKENKNSKIKFYPLVPKENIRELYQKSHVQVVPQKEGTSIGSLPSKLPNLLAANVRVLLITDPESELYRFFKEQNLSTVATSWEIRGLIKTLQNLLQSTTGYSHQRKIAEKFFTIQQMVGRILE
ncbi:MAG: glycosyltransferase family 4 protein [Polaribacter sp.]